MNDSNQQQDMCDECKKLVGAGRYTKPHQDLEATGGNTVSSMVGSVSETYYRCKNCGQEWGHETDSYGFGWIKYGRSS